MIVQEGIEENLRFLILEVRKQVEKTRKFLARPSRKLLESVRAKDDYIDNLKSIIQRKCFKHAVRDSKLQQAEIDLLKAVEIIAVNLERIADFSENIIGQAGYVIDEDVLDVYDFDPMLEVVISALDQVADAVFQQDVQIALLVCRAEDELDRMYAKVFHRVLQDMKEGGEPQSLVTVLFIFRYLERMGDSLLNVGEAVISAAMGERIKIDRFWALEDSLDSTNLTDLKENLRNVALRPMGETKSGCRISSVQNEKSGGRAVIFKEGKLGKLLDEKRSIERWHELEPGLAPQIHSFHHQGENGSILFEYLPGRTFEEIIMRKEVPDIESALRDICEVLKGVWTRTRDDKPSPAGFMKQMRSRLPDVYQLHPKFRQEGWQVDGLKFLPMEDLIEQAHALEEKHLRPPFSVFIHGDFNIDNILYDAEEKAVHFIDLNRSRFTDYLQDVSVFIVSNQRLQVFETPVRRRLNHVALSFFEFARSFAENNGDKTFQARLALGLARSLATSTRFVLDEDFAKSMFFKSRYLLEQLLKHPPDQLDTFKLPEEVLVD
ncbi:MAG: phosphotransferase [Planctomycetes bacterium]|nr:phosphotransferase [Planctomycetota bacterium]MCA8935958.1 phosphotransferase [Planctomycetota bacterium]